MFCAELIFEYIFVRGQSVKLFRLVPEFCVSFQVFAEVQLLLVLVACQSLTLKLSKNRG